MEPHSAAAPVARSAGAEPGSVAAGAAPDANASGLWPHVLLATLAVAGLPVALVWTLRATGTVESSIASAAIGIGLSLAISQLGRRLWERRPAREDLLFSELMVWGYVGRRRAERRLASALEMLGPIGPGAHAWRREEASAVSAKQRVKLLERLVASVETHDPYLRGHSSRVARHSTTIAKRMRLSRAEVARIRTAAALHDVGKVNTPTAILHKPSRLTDAEYDVIKRHSADGAEMTSVLEDGALSAIVRHHHERLDGSGYPDGSAGEAIPLGARIIAVADTFDAITSARPYRGARPHREAIETIKGEAGSKLDAAVVRTFCAHYAGRRSIAVWSFFASLPERLLSIVGGGVGSAAAAAKALVVAVAVGGAAVTTSSLALPHHRSSAHGAGAGRAVSAAPPHRSAGHGAGPLGAGAGSLGVRSAAAAAASLARARLHPTAATAPAGPAGPGGGGAPVSSRQAEAVTAAGGGAAKGSSAAGSARGLGSTRAAPGAHGRSGGESGRGRGQGVSARGNESTHGQSGVAHGRGQGSAGHGQGSAVSGAASGGHSEEAPGRGEPSHGSGEEPHGAAGGQSPGQSGEAPGQSGEAPGSGEHSGGSSQEPAHGAQDAGEASHGKSEEAQGKGF